MTGHELWKPHMKSAHLISLLTVSVCFQSANGLCAEETKPKTKTSKKYKYEFVPNHEIFSKGMGKKNARMQMMQSEMVCRTNQYRLAAEHSRKAVEADPDDMDARFAHGEALFNLIESGNTDPIVHNECVKTWLIVHRNLVGEDSGLNFKGVGIPLVQTLFSDERGKIAKTRLRKLVGRLPKAWETNRKYLTQVLKAEPEVDAKIISDLK